MGLVPPFSYPLPWNLKMEASSPLFIMRYVIGLPTFPGKPLPPRTWTATPSSTQVALCNEASPIWLGQTKIIHRRVGMWLNRSDIYWSTTSVREGYTIFMICVSWITTPSLTRTSHQRSVSRWRKKRRSINTWRHTSDRTSTYPL